ncbi:SAM-dependent methyltransferase [Nannocystis sp.]|uniref:SAM-dependent methyltransferase n=1 Tax=Nannocystis sp. TaxID=1962667 RepID=UPI0024225BFE|nr:SAM-dependent methyltransferase [Nannocystis sp.]MBK7826780.1 SAM-dependent methyltransferase [Nannocystis sp.]MBK9754401.1 SAM-dependent methyltransferase [Nannocystis sp.]
MTAIILQPIGFVRSTRRPLLDDDWDAVVARIELDPARFSPDALAGLDSFSHVEVIFHMDQVDPTRIETGARHPRNNSDWPAVGIFAQRGKNRPNQLGLSVCRIERVTGLTLELAGLDAVDGTPVLDLKPWVQEFAPRGPLRQPAWMTELMRGYWSAPTDDEPRE